MCHGSIGSGVIELQSRPYRKFNPRVIKIVVPYRLPDGVLIGNRCLYYRQWDRVLPNNLPINYGDQLGLKSLNDSLFECSRRSRSASLSFIFIQLKNIIIFCFAT
jgi:hypothetical protein